MDGAVRRRLTVLGASLMFAFALGRVGAEAEPAASHGHVVVEPGQTLWEVATATAPEGVDVRRHLEDLVALNGLQGGKVAAWTVVLLPAR